MKKQLTDLLFCQLFFDLTLYLKYKGAQNTPEHRIRQANLSVDVIRHMTIIPHLVPLVPDQTAQIFNGGDPTAA